MQDIDVILREAQCKAITGLCRTTRYVMEKKGDFPKRVQIGTRACGWRMSDIQAWIKASACSPSTQKPESTLLEKIANLELAAKRGLLHNEEIKPQLTQGQIVSVDSCSTTLKNCQLFRKWINECFESDELIAAQTDHSSEQRLQSPLPASR